MSNIATRRAYGQSLIYPSLQDAEEIFSKLFNAASSVGPDYFYWLDSDSNIIYRGYLDSENRVVSNKVLYKTFELRPDSDQDLRNAYNVRGYFTDKTQIYEHYLIWKDSDDGIPDPIILFEGGVYQVWRRTAGTDGSQKSHYNVGGYWYDQPRLSTGKIYTSIKNQQDQDFNILTWTGDNPWFIIDGVNLVSTDQVKRNIQHGKFDGYDSAVGYVKGLDSTNYEFTPSENSSNVGTDTVTVGDSNGIIYTGLRTSDNRLPLSIAKRISLEEELTFNYVTEFTDSEISAKILSVNLGDSDFVPVLTDSDANIVSNFALGDYHPDNPPWKVFGDSDNDGFKANLGVQQGNIGYRKFDLGDDERILLRQVIVKNTPATLDNSKPYDFDVEGYSIDSDTWSTILSVRGSTALVNNVSTNSTLGCSGFRVKVLSCQPGFDPAVDALEIKQIQFVVNRVRYGFVPYDSGIFVVQADLPRTFKTGLLPVTVSGALIGGGGGGGDNGTIVGGGGAGGGLIRIHSMELKPETTYELFVGNHGEVNLDGGDTYLKDVTNNVKILIAHGGGGGLANDTTATGGTGGTWTITPSGHTIDYTTYQGGNGGTYTAPGNGQNGFPGVDSDFSYYWTDDRYVTITNQNMIAGGGSGDDYNVTTGYTIENVAGGASGGFGATPTGNAAGGQFGTGGGGGGGGRRDGVRRAGQRGGRGYAYLLFK